MFHRQSTSTSSSPSSSSPPFCCFVVVVDFSYSPLHIHSLYSTFLFLYILHTYASYRVCCFFFFLLFFSFSLFLSFDSDIRLACISFVSFFVRFSFYLFIIFIHFYTQLRDKLNVINPAQYTKQFSVVGVSCFFFIHSPQFRLFLSYIYERNTNIFFCLFLFWWIRIECKIWTAKYREEEKKFLQSTQFQF